MSAKPREVRYQEVREQMLVCAGTVGSLLERAPCADLAMFVGWALAPAKGGRRTDLTMFGVCKKHVEHRQGIIADLAERGFFNATVVQWELLPELLKMLEDSGLVKVA